MGKPKCSKCSKEVPDKTWLSKSRGRCVSCTLDLLLNDPKLIEEITRNV
jgi:hypothetical protein